MSARIEIGRLSAVDLGKRVELSNTTGQLTSVEHHLSNTRIGTWSVIGIDYKDIPFLSNTLVDITGKPSPKENA